MPKDSERRLSFTYSIDVVKVIIIYMLTDSSSTEPFRAFNIACEEKQTLVEMLKLIETEIRQTKGLENATEEGQLLEPIQPSENQNAEGSASSSSSSSSGPANRAIKFYPSVDCGPISISKAREGIGFVPSNLAEALRASVEFCNHCDE